MKQNKGSIISPTVKTHSNDATKPKEGAGDIQKRADEAQVRGGQRRHYGRDGI